MLLRILSTCPAAPIFMYWSHTFVLTAAMTLVAALLYADTSVNFPGFFVFATPVLILGFSIFIVIFTEDPYEIEEHKGEE